MLTYILIALIGAVVFGVLGFTTIAKEFAAVAKIIFYLFIIGLIIAFVSGLMQ